MRHGDVIVSDMTIKEVLRSFESGKASSHESIYVPMWPELRELSAGPRLGALKKFLQREGLSRFDTQLAIRDLLRTHVELKSEPEINALLALLIAQPVEDGDDMGVPIAEILYDAFGDAHAALAVLDRSLSAAHGQTNLAEAARNEIEVLAWMTVIRLKRNEECLPLLSALQSRLVHLKPRLPILKRLRTMLPSDCPPKLKQILDRL